MSVPLRNQPRHERAANDWYVEPESVTTRLLEVERPFIGGVHDPCCGQGSVGRALERHGVRQTWHSDVVPHDYCDSVGCFSNQIPRWKMASVISNPPYNRAQEVAEVALEHARDRVCLFLRLGFLEGQKRSSWLRKTPLTRVWVFPERVLCVPGHLHGQQEGKRISSAIAYAWFVWERGHRGAPQIGWLQHTTKAQGGENG